MNFTKNQFKLYLTLVMAFCAITRVVFFVNWLHNPLREFNNFISLDMMTLQTYSINFFKEPFEFSPFFMLAYVINLFASGDNFVIVYIVLQQLFSMLIVYFTAIIAKKITGNYFIALISALIVALYGPFLLYSGVFLREIMYLLFATISLLLLIDYRKKKSYVIWLSILMGIVFGVRAAGVSWALAAGAWILIREINLHYKQNKKKKIAMILRTLQHNYYLKTLIISYFFVALGILSFNTIKNGEVFNSFDNYDYYYKVGAQKKISSLNVAVENKNKVTDKPNLKERSKSMKISQFSLNPYIIKIKQLLTPYFLPNNINYYFWRERIPFLKFTIGMVLFYSVVVAAILINIKKFIFRKDAVLGFYCASFALPFIVFVPLGRYTLIFTVPFAIYIAIFINQIIDFIKNKKYLWLCVSLLVLAAVSVTYIIILKSKKVLSRSSDYVGLLAIDEKNSGLLEKNYQDACSYFPNNPDFIFQYSQYLLKNKRGNKAKILLENFQNNPETRKNLDTTLLLTVIYLTNGKFNQAKKCLDQLDIEKAYKTSRNKDIKDVNLQTAMYYNFYADALSNVETKGNIIAKNDIVLKYFYRALYFLDLKVHRHRNLSTIINQKIKDLKENKLK